MENTLTIQEAARWLGVSRNKIGAMVKAGELEARPNPLDKRERLIPARAIEELRGSGRGPRPNRLAMVGAVSDPSFQSEDVETYLEELARRA